MKGGGYVSDDFQKEQTQMKKVGGVYLDPTIRLDHIVTALVTVISASAFVGIIYASIQNDIDHLNTYKAEKRDVAIIEQKVEYLAKNAEKNEERTLAQFEKVADSLTNLNENVNKGFQRLEDKLDRKEDKK